MRSTVIAAVVLMGLGSARPAAAQYFDDTSVGYVEDVSSPETWALELRGGTYQPNAGTAFTDFFADDQGPMLAVELDYLPFEVKDWIDVGIGFGFGWSQYVGKSLDMGGNPTGEDTSLTLYPLPIMAVLRVDALSRQLDVPLLVAGKLGADFVVWNTGTGDRSEATNVTIGLRWGVQLAFELDIINRRAARALDEVWGINHTFIGFELYGSTASTNLDASPVDGIAWALSLGFVF